MLKHAIRTVAASAVMAITLTSPAQAVTDIPFWHAMEGELGKTLDALADRFNRAQSDVRIVPVYKGNYEQTLAAGIAAYRSGNAPAILQVYEVGTATMMASKAIKPVYEVFQQSGVPFDERVFVPTVSGYYTDAKSGHLLSQPFNSSTPVLYYNKDAFKKAAWIRNSRPKPGRKWRNIRPNCGPPA